MPSTTTNLNPTNSPLPTCRSLSHLLSLCSSRSVQGAFFSLSSSAPSFLSGMAAVKLSFVICVLAVLAVNFADGASSRDAPAPAADCSTLILNMADCLSFVSNDSTTTKPEGGCCTGLKTVLKANADCLCQAFKNSAQLGVVLNITKALSLPAACKVSTPAAANCKLSNSPAGAPAMTPTASPGSSTAVTPEAASTATHEPTPAPAPRSSASPALTISVGSLIAAIGAALSYSF